MTPANFGAVRRLLHGAAVLALLASPASSQVVEKGRTFADLTATHPCSSAYTDRIARVTDCDAADDIGDGGGAFQCWATCDGSAPWTTQAIGGGGAGLADGDKGDITVASSGAAWTVDADSVALGTDTTGNYAGSASEGGEANTLAPAVVIEGTTADDYEGNFAFADPTADWTWTWSGTGAVSGVTGITGGSSGSSTLSLDGDSTVTGGVRIEPDGGIALTTGTRYINIAGTLYMSYDWLTFRQSGIVSWTSTGTAADATSGVDVTLGRDDEAGVLSQRKATQAQTFRLYGLADARPTLTNYERLSLSCDGSADCTIAPETAGTGADNINLHLSGVGTGYTEIAGCKSWGLLASPPATCDAGNECAEYSDTSHARCYCDGTTWNVLTGSGAGACS